MIHQQVVWQQTGLVQSLALMAALLLISVPVSADETRTWSDATGRFKIEAKYVSQENGKLKLLRADGRTVEIELSKLSAADQEYVKELESNPFRTTNDAPVMPAKPGTTPASADSADSSVAPTVTAGARAGWGSSKLVDISAYGDGWDFEASSNSQLDFVPKTVSLPKRVDFFEKLDRMQISHDGKKGVAGYLWNFGSRNKEPQSRLVLFDLVSGRTTAEVTINVQYVPLAIHPDGKHLLMKNAERNQDNVEVWLVEGNRVRERQDFQPHNESWGKSSPVSWAKFADETRLVIKLENGWTTVWDFAQRQPLCHFQIDGGSTPALSFDGSTLAFYHKERVGLFDLEGFEVMAIQKVPRRLNWVHLAFSPSEKRLACVAFDSILVWETETGELYRDFQPAGLHMNMALHYPNDDFVLAGNRYLVELENMIKLWDYEGADQVQSLGGAMFFAVSPQNEPGAVMPALLPHEPALQALDAALNQPDLFIFRKGVQVRLDLNGIPAEQKSAVEAGLRRKLAELDISVTADAPVTVKASVTGPKQEQINYIASGTYTVQVYTTQVEVVYEGKSAWQASGSNIPHFVRLSSGENLGDVLREKSKQADFGFFERVNFPKFLQKPAGEAQPGRTGGQTIGSSKVVSTAPAANQPRGRRR